MKTKFFAVYKVAFFSFLIDPLFYVASVLSVLFCSFKFFFVGKFFVETLGSSDLHPFFIAMPQISVLVIPLLVFRLRSYVTDASLPTSPTVRFFALASAAFTAFLIPAVLLLSVPFCAETFADVDSGQLLAGYAGIILYSFAASSFVVFLFAALSSVPALPLLVSMTLLTVCNFMHLLPLYVNVGSAISFLCPKLSFAWHFDSYGKGIIDTRDFVFYAVSAFAFVLLAVCSEYIHIGKKISKKLVLLFSLTLFFLASSSERLYVRADVTHDKKFSVSDTSRRIIQELDSPLRITYFRSKELRNFYPQTSDVAEYILDYCSYNKNMTFSIEVADPERLASLGVQGQQIKSETGTKTEFITVYSAILLQYLEKSTLIPFVLSTQTLEFDLTQRIQQLVQERERRAFVINGNGLGFDHHYSFVLPWLASRGFKAEILDDFSMTYVLDSLSASDCVVVIGSSLLTEDQSAAIERAVKRGCPAFIATSQYHSDLENDWSVTRSVGDTLVPALSSWGFAFDNALVEDISCFPMTLESGEGSEAIYSTVNYPLWLSVLPQPAARRGMALFWASPIQVYNDAVPIIKTSNLAWIQHEAKGTGIPFLINPLTMPKNAKDSDAVNSQYVLAATADSVSGYYEPGKSKAHVTVVSDQYFLNTFMMRSISGTPAGDFRNYDFLVSELFRLRGDEELSVLMEKSQTTTALYKITDAQQFMRARMSTILINFIVIPLIFVVFFVFMAFFRQRLFVRKWEIQK